MCVCVCMSREEMTKRGSKSTAGAVECLFGVDVVVEGFGFWMVVLVFFWEWVERGDVWDFYGVLFEPGRIM